ncbi:hypothetical protein B0T25DRAFT_565875 [Lasiosphaeria hispida]|uniref:RTA1 domain protein n=1 Tax=Lasiosphaeria hispida TaxID=260671 RepID=A0AAJ0HKM3_9PEZI|nr:hypothetical protein B0T25DRAFT_565875 [Lasiosphaeria hispida]
MSDSGGPNDAPVIIYSYTPSFALIIVAGNNLILFFIFFVVHLCQTTRYRSWYFATFPVGLLFEIIGYKGESDNPIYSVLNCFFIVTAPVFLSAGIYTTLSALIHRLGKELPAGAALIGVKQTKRQDPAVANYILLGGLEYQVIAICIFIILTVKADGRVSLLVGAQRKIRPETTHGDYVQ